jgi:hypothetical protein
MDTPIRMPFLERRKDNLHIQKPVQPNGAATWPARSFVKLAAGVLTPCVTADTVCYGWAPEPSLGTPATPPPGSLYGLNHWPQDPSGPAQFVVNITDGSGHIGQANGAPQLSALAIGTSYGLYRDGNGIQYLNTADTTNLFFKLVALYPGQALTDYNGLALVEIVAAAIQA